MLLTMGEDAPPSLSDMLIFIYKAQIRISRHK